MDLPSWVVARTKPNQEKIAIRNLENQKFGYYQPLILERRKVKGVFKQVEQPLFPNYLFVRIVDRWNVLNSTYGIASIICNGAHPAIVKDNIINDLMIREVNGYIKLPAMKKMVAGDKVTIVKGPFAGHSALVDRMPAKERQKILLSLLSGQIKLLLEEDEVEVA